MSYRFITIAVIIIVSQMDSDHFVPVSVLANFNQVLININNVDF